MTRKTLNKRIKTVLVIYCIAVITAISLRVAFPDEKGTPSIAYQTYKDLIPFLLAIPAAWLGYCFQRRSSYLAALRQLWGQLIPAVQTAIQFTHLQNPTKEDFSNVQKELSIVTDSLRGVFENIPNRDPVGLYPYENLKQIQKIVSWLYLETQNSADEKYWARRMVKTLWASMHHMLLLEFDRETKALKSINLDDFSVEDLKEYINELNNELARVKKETEKKIKIQSKADSFFK